MAQCELRASLGTPGITCDEDACVFWRVVEQLDVDAGPARRACAIQHFALLEGGEEIARWLASVKDRVERDAPGDERG